MSILEKLTEGIVNRDLQKEGAALLNKWEKTGLLEGMKDERSKDTMARLLENQAKELLREASSMYAGDSSSSSTSQSTEIAQAHQKLVIKLTNPSMVVMLLPKVFSKVLISESPGLMTSKKQDHMV